MRHDCGMTAAAAVRVVSDGMPGVERDQPPAVVAEVLWGRAQLPHQVHSMRRTAEFEYRQQHRQGDAADHATHQEHHQGFDQGCC